jgi:5-formyltetrahydrofolate cyclo-ligase
MRRIRHEESGDSNSVCEAVYQWLASRPNLHTIAVFTALPGEPDLADLVARHPDRRWVYPRVLGDHLTFHAVEKPALELAVGAFGILEPLPTLAEVAVDQIDVFLCPGIAFDTRGGRLGRGRGFYDRMLAKARPDAIKIGVCFPSQIVTDTFPEPHDIHMDAVVCGNN